MKAIDLRIGNKVNFKYKGNLYQGWISTIDYKTANILTCTSFIGNFNNFSMIQGAVIHSVKFENIEPIKLTEEILLKCGFVISKTTAPIRYKYKNEKLLFVITKWKSENSFYVGRYSNCEIKYLHQLQNLYFALTQTELEINI